MKKLALALLVSAACNKTDPAKDKEIEELKAKVEALSKPSLGSVAPNAQPPITNPQNRAIEESSGPLSPEEFPTSMIGQLNRIDSDISKASARNEVGDEDNKALGLHPDGLPSQFVYSFAKRPDIPKVMTYKRLWESSGRPYNQRVKLLEIMPLKGAITNGFHGRATIDYYQTMPIYIASRYPMTFHADDEVDVIGYITDLYTYHTANNTEVSIPGMAVVAVVKPGSIQRLKKSRAGIKTKSAK